LISGEICQPLKIIQPLKSSIDKDINAASYLD